MQTNLRAVLAGCGSIAGAWLKSPSLQEGVTLTGFCDLNKDAARRRALDAGCPDAATGTDLDAMLALLKPDVVLDCTVPEAHHAVTLTALKHGCHVLGEKPMADTMAHAREMVQAAQNAGRIYAVIQNRRYQHPICAFRHFLATGAIGELTLVQSDFYIGAHFDGFRAQMEHVLLLDMAIHTFDQARMISGVNAQSVCAHEWNPSGSWYRHGASAQAVFRMENGLVYLYNASWCAEGLNTPWAGVWRVVGTQGSASWDGDTGFRCQRVREGPGLIWPTEELEIPYTGRELTRTEHDGVIADFIHAVQQGTLPPTICTDNIHSLAMVHGAIASAEQNKEMKLQP